MFLLRLALRAGEVDVDAMARKVSRRQLVEWMAFWTLEPWGDEWRRSGRLAAVMAAASGATTEVEIEERFLPSYRETPQTPEEMRAVLMGIPAFAKQMNG